MTTVGTRFLQANGLRFAVDEAGGRTGDVALLLHGFPESRVSWRRQLPALAALGWHAVAPDLRGYGDSSRPVGRDNYRLDHLVADVGALFDALGARRRLLVGHDWGALIAWEAAMRSVRPLDGLVILNVPHPAVFRQVLRTSWNQRLRSWYVGFFQLPGLPERLLAAGGGRGLMLMLAGAGGDRAIPPDVMAQYRRNAIQPGALTAMIDYYRVNARDLALGRGPVPVIDTPTLMIWGEDDAALSLRLSEGHERFCADFTRHRLPGISHWVQQEAPDAVNRLMTDWLVAKGLGPGAQPLNANDAAASQGPPR